MQRKNEQSIGEILREYLKITQLENHVFEGKIADLWRETLGDAITAETERIHLSGGVLVIVLRSPSLKNEIMMRRTAIRMTLNEKLGSDVIKQVVVR